MSCETKFAARERICAIELLDDFGKQADWLSKLVDGTQVHLIKSETDRTPEAVARAQHRSQKGLLSHKPAKCESQRMCAAILAGVTLDSFDDQCDGATARVNNHDLILGNEETVVPQLRNAIQEKGGKLVELHVVMKFGAKRQA